MGMRSRPVSPHLQIYRPQLTSILSILHRLTGVALAAGTLVLACWLIAAALGAGPFMAVEAVIASWIGRLALFGWSFALFFHSSNGIRHLFWDAGIGYGLGSVNASGMVVVVVSAALTVGAWYWGYAAMGAWS